MEAFIVTGGRVETEEATWANLANLGQLGANLGQLGTNLGQLGTNLGPPWGQPGATLGPTWAQQKQSAQIVAEPCQTRLAERSSKTQVVFQRAPVANV